MPELHPRFRPSLSVDSCGRWPAGASYELRVVEKSEYPICGTMQKFWVAWTRTINKFHMGNSMKYMNQSVPPSDCHQHCIGAVRCFRLNLRSYVLASAFVLARQGNCDSPRSPRFTSPHLWSLDSQFKQSTSQIAMCQLGWSWRDQNSRGSPSCTFGFNHLMDCQRWLQLCAADLLYRHGPVSRSSGI